MASRTPGTLNKIGLLSIILWSGIFVAFFSVGIALDIIVNPGILFIFIVLGLSLSTIAVDYAKVKMNARHDVKPQRLSSSPGLCVAKLETNAPTYAEERITIYPASSTTTNRSDPFLCIEWNVSDMRSYSRSLIYSSDERTGPITYVPRRSSAQLLPGPTLPDLGTSSDSAICEGVRSLSYRRPYSCYEGRKAYRIYDLNSEDSYDTTSRSVTLDTTEPLHEDNLVRTPSTPEKIANRSPEPKSVFLDMGTTGRTRPADEFRKSDNEVRSHTTCVADEDVVKPQVSPQETPVITTKVDAYDEVDIGKEGSSGVSQEAEDESSSEDTVDLKAKGSGAPSKVSLSPPGSRNTDRTYKGKVYKKDTTLQQASTSDPMDDEDSTRTESEIAWVSLSTSTRCSSVLPDNETSGTTDEQRLCLKRDELLEDSIQKELSMPFNGLNHSNPKRTKSAAFSAGDKAHRDRRSHGSSKSAHSVKDSASQTSITASRGGDRNEFSVAPLVKAEVVKVTVISSPLSEESSQECSAGPTEPRKVSCSEYVQATAKIRNRASQSEVRQAAPESPKKKRLTGRLFMFLRPRKKKQGITSFYREQRSK